MVARILGMGSQGQQPGQNWVVLPPYPHVPLNIPLHPFRGTCLSLGTSAVDDSSISSIQSFPRVIKFKSRRNHQVIYSDSCVSQATNTLNLTTEMRPRYYSLQEPKLSWLHLHCNAILGYSKPVISKYNGLTILTSL